MDWRQYQEMASQTVAYPGAEWDHLGIFYATFGLVDEVAEVYEALDSAEDALYLLQNISPVASDKLKAELSDCLWYVARIVAEWRLDWDALETEVKELQDKIEPQSLIESYHLMIVSAGNICGVAKKYLRDEDFHLNAPSQAKRTQVQFLLANALVGLYNMLYLLNLSLDELMQINLDKLFSRKKRGKLHGEGDNR